jgi:hypothetical protein
MGPVTLVTAMTREECVERLRGSIHSQKIGKLGARRTRPDHRAQQKPLRGEIDGDRFRIQRQHRFSRGDDEVGPICFGEFQPRGEGTSVVLRFELHPLLKWSYIGLLTVIMVSGYQVLFGLIFGVLSWRLYWPDVISHTALGILVIAFMYFSIPRREQEYIVDFLKWKFDATITSRRL